MSSPPNRYAQIELAIDLVANFEKVLDGLKAWRQLDLIDNVDLRVQVRQAYASYARLRVEIKPELLEGLEQWLDLGILTPAEAIRFCSKELTCDRMESFATVSTPAYTPVTAADTSTTSVRVPPQVTTPTSSPQMPPPINPLGKMAKSLVAEFSLVWLLFLGVFLVVVSSGVLAATQWDRFSAQGQYLILFAYTLAFWGVSFWTLKQGNLLLTTRTLQLVTLLIIPANFWAIDGLGLLNNPIGLGISAIAGISLSGVTVSLLRQAGRRTSNLGIAGLIFLSWLHLGWGIRFYPAIAVYLGIVSMAIALLPQQRVRHALTNTPDSTDLSVGFPIHLIASGSAIVLLVVRSLLFANVRLSQLGLAFGLCGLILHLITVPKLPQANRLDSQSETESIDRSNLSIPQVQANQNLGIGLLVLGWLVSVGETYPWQALIISCIALVLLADRLLTERSQHTPTKTQLTAIFLLGLQTIALCIPFIPQGVRATLVEWAARITDTTAESILGVVFIPYVWLTLWFSGRLRSRHHRNLAQHGQLLALLFGVLLTWISFFSPLTRMGNLLLSAGTLLVLETRDRNIAQATSRTGLIYLTHITGLAAIASTISYFFPNLASTNWIVIVLLTMLLEWGNVFYQGYRAHAQTSAREVGIAPVTQRNRSWSDSSWNIGLCLAGLSYVTILGLTYQWLYFRLGDGLSTASSNLRVLWLVTPAALTFLGSRRYLWQAQLAVDCSITALLLAQVLMWNAPDSLLISLGIATILMLFNIRHSEHISTAWFTVGLGLGFIGALLWALKQNDPIESQLIFYTNGAAASVLILFLLGHWLRNRQKRAPSNLNLPLNQMYVQAFDLWAIPISLVILTSQTLAIFPVWGMAPAIATDWIDRAFTQTLFSTAIVAGATIYRIWQAPAPWATWIVAWSVELLILRGVIAANGTSEHAGIANLGLGLAMQLGGDWLYALRRMRQSGHDYPISWQVIPLTYGFLGWLFSLSIFSAVSGLYSLAAVLIFIGIGRREAESNSGFKSLVYLGVVGITFSLYQLLIYQLSRASGGSWGDGLILMGSLSAAIAIAYRTCTRWLNFYLKLSEWEIAGIAHLHWFAGAALLLLAAIFNPSQTGGWLGCTVLAVLSIYAAWQGRDRQLLPDNLSEQPTEQIAIQTSAHETWVYASVVTGIGALVFLLYFAFPEAQLIVTVLRPYGAVLACIIGYGLFVLPWREWGWSPRPWRRSAGCLPLVMGILTADAVTVPSLLIVATFYAAIARLYNAIRLTYISVILSNWALFRFYHFQNLTHSLWYVLALGMSALYLIQVEPSLRSPAARETRHTFRLFSAGSIGLTALLHSPSNLPMSLVAAAIGIVFVLSGLAMRVRAYLFVGTITFISVVLMQVLSLIAQYSFLIWAILICAGIALILIVANFEARRDRMLALWQGLIGELSTWD